ncbi:hypothetical protein Vafri_6243 [Volvox africanus]|uniref:Multiple C2 domain-containing protein n=1 Tax=Volvox africanus TaxID=51714 RepID=A0A8J4AY66_9CHLO|nr:hypothetical protein Vafri_6243 [Volvox africanus]
MAHPFQQRKLLVTVCKAEIGWDQPESSALQSGYVTLVAGPFRASTRTVPATRKTRPGILLSGPASGPSGPSGPGPGQVLSWAPSLGPELFVLTEDCLLVADLVVGAELWGQKSGGRWNNSETLYGQAEICLDAEGQALLLSGRCLEVRLPLMQPQGQGGGGKGKGGAASAGAGGGAAAGSTSRPTAAATAAATSPPTPVLGVLALSMLLQPADAEAAVARQLPPELVPRLLIDTTRLLPGAVVRGASGVAYVEPCVMFLRVRMISATGLGRGGKEGVPSRSSIPGHHPHPHHPHTPHHHNHHSSHGGGEGGSRGPFPALSGQLQELGAKFQAHVNRTMGHVGTFLNRLKERGGKNRGLVAAAATVAAVGQRTQSITVAAPPPATAGGTTRRKSMEDVQSHEIRTSNNGSGSGGGGWEAGVDHAAAEAVMSLLESNGFAVVDNRRLSNYFWCKVSYEGQYHTSRLVPVVGGAVRWDETFVMAALRPARTAPLEIELYGSNDSRSRGKVVCQLSIPLCDLIDQVLRNHHHRVSEQENQRKDQLHREEQEQLLQELNYRQRRHPRSRFGIMPAVRAVRSAFSSVAMAAAAAVGAGGGGAARLPPYHPETWPRGRAMLTARIGGPGGHASATHGSPIGPDGGVRECTFHFEVELVDADTRAAANDTQILPWSTAQQQQSHSHLGQHHLQSLQGGGLPAAAAVAATACESDFAPDSASLYGAGGGTATRRGSTSSMVIAAAVTTSATAGAILSPPWSPLSRNGGDVLNPGGTALSGVVSLGSVVAACFIHEASAPATRQPPTEAAEALPPPPLPGEEDIWLPPQGLPHIRSHVADGNAVADAAVQRPSSPASTAAYELDDSPIAPNPSVSTMAPETGVPCTPTIGVDSVRQPSAAATAAAAAAGPPPAGLCPASALAASASATLSLVCHDLELERPPEAAMGGSGVAVGGQAAQHAAAVAAITQGDYFVAIRCGPVWVTTNSLRVVGTGMSGGSAAAAAVSGGARLTPHLGLVAPLLKPSTLVSLALFRRTDVVAGKKVLNVRAMIGMMASEQLIGKLRLRTSSLVPGKPVTISLPLKAERSGPRPCATAAWCRMTLLMTLGPMGLPRLVAAYAAPPTYPPIAMLQAGAVPGQGLSDTLPLTDPTKRVESEALKRRERRLVIKWVSESSPGLSANASRKLVEDGRTEFNLGRTTQNWRRIGRALSSADPLKLFWARVQSWSSPPLTLAVAAAEVALLLWPSRTLALLLLALMARMLVQRATLLRPSDEGDEVPMDKNGDSAAAAAAAAAATEVASDAAGGDGDANGRRMRGGSGAAAAMVHFGEPPVMVEDIGNEPEGGGGGGGGDTASDQPNPTGNLAAGASSVPPTPTAAGSSAASSGLTAAAAAAASSNPISIPPSPTLQSSTPLNVTATATIAASRIFGTSPPAAAMTGGGGEWAAPQQRGGAGNAGGGGGSSFGGAEVPKDPLGALRQQYDHMVYFGLRVQNVLDDIAGGIERLQALFSWRDPVASGCFVLSLALTAVMLWTVGMRFVLGAVLLYDLRPPRWRDPWLPPPANVFAHLPTRADLMM